jgi:hypothetical protein
MQKVADQRIVLTLSGVKVNIFSIYGKKAQKNKININGDRYSADENRNQVQRTQV